MYDWFLIINYILLVKDNIWWWRFGLSIVCYRLLWADYYFSAGHFNDQSNWTIVFLIAAFFFSIFVSGTAKVETVTWLHVAEHALCRIMSLKWEQHNYEHIMCLYGLKSMTKNTIAWQCAWWINRYKLELILFIHCDLYTKRTQYIK